MGDVDVVVLLVAVGDVVAVELVMVDAAVLLAGVDRAVPRK